MQCCRHPCFQGRVARILFVESRVGRAHQRLLLRGRQRGAKGGFQHGAQAIGQRWVGPPCVQGQQAFRIGAGQSCRLCDALPGEAGEAHVQVGLGWPAIAGSAREGDVEFGTRLSELWVAVEEPLSGVVGIGLWEAVGVFLGRDLLPVE